MDSKEITAIILQIESKFGCSCMTGTQVKDCLKELLKLRVFVARLAKEPCPHKCRDKYVPENEWCFKCQAKQLIEECEV